MVDFIDRVRAALADRYTVKRELGCGGMATVFLAEDQKHNREVAIKVIRPEIAISVGVDRFLREIGIAARLSHPHIVPVYDSGDADDMMYYVMPYVEGESLREKLERDKQIDTMEAIEIAGEIASALAYAQATGDWRRGERVDHGPRDRGRHADVHESRAGQRGGPSRRPE
jgi:serine/threonine-protein kinase